MPKIGDKKPVVKNGLGITDIRIRVIQNDKLQGVASITFNGVFAVTGIKIVNGNKGVFVAMPSQKGKKDDYYDVAFPVTKEAREELNKLILEAYEQA